MAARPVRLPVQSPRSPHGSRPQLSTPRGTRRCPSPIPFAASDDRPDPSSPRLRGVLRPSPAGAPHAASPFPPHHRSRHATVVHDPGLPAPARQRAGDVLFTLDSSDLSAARGDAARARDAAAQASRDLDRQQLLFDADIAARKDLEAAQLAHAQAANDLRTAQARLAQLGASADDNAGRRLSVRAPLAGRVIEMNAAPGGYWNDVNAPLMTIADLSRVSVTAAVPEKDLARIFVGQSAQVVLNAYPDDPRAGTVRYIGEVLDPDTRTVKVRLILDNADGRLRPGMFVKLRFAGPSHPAPVVPASALLQEGLFTRVFVERAPGRYVAREVSVGAALGDQVEIVSGLRPGERVVVRDGVLLHD
ncbi:efflux RND transporter periplasmic adaptor subunit [Mitsuaria sp. TWR114]|nr:efflux RND transporter periplasmic adaptor subunit [Mitsuaria sp. TWR114]